MAVKSSSFDRSLSAHSRYCYHCGHGTHIRSQKTRDVRPLEPHGQAVHAHCQGHRYRGASGGADPAANPTLRRVLQNARAVNMPKDKTDAAIRRASGKEAANYLEILYEGYAPHGVALLVETATDNPTRTVGNVRNIFAKNGGNLGTTGSVSFQFQKMGVFRLDPAAVKDQDELELDLIDYGLEEMGESTGEKGEAQLVIRCAFNDFGRLQERLEKRGLTPLSAEHEYICSVPDRVARGAGCRGPGADRQARTGRRRAESVPHARLKRRQPPVKDR